MPTAAYAVTALYARTCMHCGEDFTAQRSAARYCTKRCKQIARDRRRYRAHPEKFKARSKARHARLRGSGSRQCATCARPSTSQQHRYCDECRAVAAKRRNNRPNRALRDPAQHKLDYGSAHRKIRKHLAPHVAAGLFNCARCQEPINPGEPWDLDHNDEDRSKYNGPTHSRCNRATAGRGRSRRPFRLRIITWPTPHELRRREASRKREARKHERTQRAERKRQQRIELAKRALAMRDTGAKWEDIATAFGYATSGGVYCFVTDTLGQKPRGRGHRPWTTNPPFSVDPTA